MRRINSLRSSKQDRRRSFLALRLTKVLETLVYIYIYLKALRCASLYLSRPCSTEPIFHYNLKTVYSNRSHIILWEDPRDIKGAKIRFTSVPFIILGRRVFDCQHGKDRKAGEKRKREDAEEVNKILYCTYIFFIHDIGVATVTYGLLTRKVKYTYRWVKWHWSQNTFMTTAITVQSQKPLTDVCCWQKRK